MVLILPSVEIGPCQRDVERTYGCLRSHGMRLQRARAASPQYLRLSGARRALLGVRSPAWPAREAAIAPDPAEKLSNVAHGTALGLADDLVGEEGEAVADGPGVEEAHAVLVAGLLEEAFAGPERDRVNHQP